MGNADSIPESVTLGNSCDRNSQVRNLNNYVDNRPEYMRQMSDTSQLGLTICNTRCRYADKWYKIRVYHGNTYLGNLTIFWQSRRDRSTPHSLGLVSDDQVREYNVSDGCIRMFWKIRRSKDFPSGQTPQDRPYDLVNMAFEEYTPYIYDRAGNPNQSLGRKGAVTSAFCAGGSQCSKGWRIPCMRLHGWDSNVGNANNNVRFYMNNFVEIGGQFMPSKHQDRITVLSEEGERSGTGSFKRRLYTDIQNSRMSSGNALKPYWEVGYNVDNNIEEQNLPIRFEFVPYNREGNTLKESDDEVDFVYDMEDHENILFCYYLCCSQKKDTATTRDVCYNVYTDFLQQYATNTGNNVNDLKYEFTKDMCSINPDNPRTIMKLTKPECQNVCLASGSRNFNRCRDNLENFCQSADLDMISDPAERSIAELYCACYMDQAYYDRMANELLRGLRGTPAEQFFRNLIATDRWKPYCWFGLCQESPYNPSRTSEVPGCTPIEFNVCLQYIDVTTRDGKIVFDIDHDGLNQCIINNLPDSGTFPIPDPVDPEPIPDPVDPNDPGNGQTNRPGNGQTNRPGNGQNDRPIPDPGNGPSSGKKGQSLIWIIGGSVVFLLLIGLIVIISASKKKKQNNRGSTE